MVRVRLTGIEGGGAKGACEAGIDGETERARQALIESSLMRTERVERERWFEEKELYHLKSVF